MARYKSRSRSYSPRRSKSPIRRRRVDDRSRPSSTAVGAAGFGAIVDTTPSNWTSAAARAVTSATTSVSRH